MEFEYSKDGASMGPRLFRRGGVVVREPGAAKVSASMGPRLFRRGGVTPFNHAAIKRRLLQWGHAFSGVEAVGGVALVAGLDLASMGPRLFRRGGRQRRSQRRQVQ